MISRRLEFPVLGNEVRRLSRKPSVHGVRLGVIGLVFVAMLITAPVQMAAGAASSAAEMMSGFIQFMIAFMVAIASWVLPLIRSTEAFAAERRDGTLPILLLASTSIADIYFGKALIILMESAILLLSVLPLYAIGMYFGGIAAADIAQTMLSAVAHAILVTALGLYFSAATRSVLAARVYTLGLFIFIAFFTFVYQWVAPWLGLPMSALYGSYSTMRIVTLAVGLGMVVISVFAGMRALAKLSAPASSGRRRGKAAKINPDEVVETRTRPRLRSSASRPARRRESKDPVAALLRGAVLGMGMRDYGIGIRILATFVFSLIALIPGFGSFVIALILYWDTLSSLDSLKTSGAFDDIRSVPCSDEELSRSIFRALFRGGIPYLVALTAGPLVYTAAFGAFAFAMMEWGKWAFVGAVAVGVVGAVSKYASLIAFSSYWGVTWGANRFSGFFVYLGILLVGSTAGGILDIALAAWLYDMSSFLAPGPFPGGFSVSVLLPSILLMAFAFFIARRLGKRWRDDLGTGLRRLPPQVLEKVSG